MTAAPPPYSCEACPIGRHTVYETLFTTTPGEVTTLRRAIHRFARGRQIVRSGDVPEFIYTLFSGWAYKFQVTPNGKRQILDVFIPGDMLVPDFLVCAPISYSIKCATEVTLCALDRNRFVERLRTSPELSKNLYRQYVEKHNSLEKSLTYLGRYSAEARLAQFFVSINTRLMQVGLSSNGHFPLPLSQRLVADALGLTAVYVNRILINFRNRDVLTFKNGNVEISNPRALADIANAG